MKLLSLLVMIFIFSAESIAQDLWHQYNSSNAGLENNRISAIAIGRDNSLWAAYTGAGGMGVGIVNFDGTTWTQYNSSNSGLFNNDIRAIIADLDGNMWFACYNAGIVKFDGSYWTRYTTDNSGLVGNNVSSLKVDQEGNVWIGAYFSGISKFDGTNWINYNVGNSPFPSINCINDLAIDDEGNLWVAHGCAAGVTMLNTDSNMWTVYNTSNSQIPHHSASAIIQDNSGKMWIGYPSGINVISSLNENVWTNYNPFSSGFGGVGYGGFAIHSNGDILCGTYGNGLFKFDGTNWANVPIPLTNSGHSSFTQSVAVDSHDNIWWAEFDKGIWTNGNIILPKAPEDFKAETVNAVSIKLMWKSQAIAVTGYEVERKGPGEKNFMKIATLSSGNLAYLDDQLIEGTTYEYRGKAFNEDGASKYTNVSQVQTNDKPAGSSFSKNTLEDETLNFTSLDFTAHFSDADLADALVMIQLNSLPEKGVLALNGTTITSIQNITIEELDDLDFVPFPDENGETVFSFFFNDGKDNSSVLYEAMISIIPVEEPIVSVSEDLVEKKFHFYPNPVTTDLFIVNNDPRYWPYQITVCNILGQELRGYQVTGKKFILGMNDLQAGFYIIKIKTSNGLKISKKMEVR